MPLTMSHVFPSDYIYFPTFRNGNTPSTVELEGHVVHDGEIL